MNICIMQILHKNTPFNFILVLGADKVSIQADLLEKPL